MAINDTMNSGSHNDVGATQTITLGSPTLLNGAGSGVTIVTPSDATTQPSIIGPTTGEALALQNTDVDASEPLTVERYISDFLAGKGDDNPVYQQFAIDHKDAIEEALNQSRQDNADLDGKAKEIFAQIPDEIRPTKEELRNSPELQAALARKIKAQLAAITTPELPPAVEAPVVATEASQTQPTATQTVNSTTASELPPDAILALDAAAQPDARDSEPLFSEIPEAEAPIVAEPAVAAAPNAEAPVVEPVAAEAPDAEEPASEAAEAEAPDTTAEEEEARQAEAARAAQAAAAANAAATGPAVDPASNVVAFTGGPDRSRPANDINGAPSGDNNSGELANPDGNAQTNGQFTDDQLAALRHFTRTYKNVYTRHREDSREPDGIHAGVHFSRINKNAYDISVTPQSITVHGHTSDAVLKHSIILAMQMYGGNVNIQNVSKIPPKMMERMEKLARELYRDGKLVDHNGDPFPPNKPLIFHGISLNGVTAEPAPSQAATGAGPQIVLRRAAASAPTM